MPVERYLTNLKLALNSQTEAIVGILKGGNDYDTHVSYAYKLKEVWKELK